MEGRSLTANLLFIFFFAAAGILAALLFFGQIGNRGTARFGDGKVTFPPGKASLASGFVIIAFLVQSAVRHLVRHHGGVADWLIQGLLLVGSLALLSDLPGTIIVTDAGLEQVYWFRRRVRLSWDAISEVKLNPHVITIQGENGSKIVHTSRQVDRARLLVELKHHCGDDLPPEFPGEPCKPK